MGSVDEILFEINPLPTWIYNAQTKLLMDVNPAALQLFGFDNNEALPMHLGELRLSDVAGVNSNIEEQLSKTSARLALETYRKKNGELVRIETRSQLCDWAGENAVLVVGKLALEGGEISISQGTEVSGVSGYGKFTMVGVLDFGGSFVELMSDGSEVIGQLALAETGIDFWNVIHIDDLVRVNAAWQQMKAGIDTYVEAFRMSDPTGQWHWVEAHFVGRLINEQISGICLYVKVVTERIEALSRLQLFERIITHTKDAVLVTEAEPTEEPGPRIVYVNEAFTKMTGYAAHEVVGKTPRILQGPLSDYKELKKLSEALKKWESYEVTTVNYKKNGDPFWVNFTVTPIANSLGYYTHWIAIERDVTASIELAENLTKAKEFAEDNERKMKEAQRLAQLGSWYYDFVNQISFWSEETFRIWGLDPKAGIITFDEHEPLVHPKDWRRFGEVINHAIQNAIPYKMELEVRNADGTYKTVNTIGTPVFDDHGKLIAFKGTTQDISDRVAIENELRAAKEKAERMQYIIAEASHLAKIGYVDHDFTTDIIIWSDYMYQLYGLINTERALVDAERENFYDTVSREKLHTANELLRMQGVAYDLELRMINALGQEVFVRKLVHPVFSDKQVVIGKRGVIRNITEEVYMRELNRDVARMVKLGSWRVDLIENTVYWSEQVHHIHETDPMTFVPTLQAGIEFYRSDFRNAVQIAVEKASVDGNSWDYEAVIVTANNKERWIRSTGNVELIDGKVVRLYGGFQDIHEKKVAQLALEASLRELQDYKFSLDQSAIIAFTDAKGVITDVNENFCNISGYSKIELVGNTHRIVGSNYHPAEFFKALWRTISAGKVWRGEIKNKRKDGSYYWVDTTIVPFLNKQQQPEQYLAIRFDITDRKKVESDFLDSAERLRLATSSVKMGIWDWDVVNDVLNWDDRMFEMYGIRREDFTAVFAAWQKGTHPDDVARVTQSLKDAMAGGKEFHEVFRVVWPDGSIRYIEAHAVVTRTDDGQPQRVIGGNIDITSKVENEALLQQHANDLERYNESLRSIAWTQSHVVRAPLARILSIINLIELEKNGDESREELIGYLKTATEEMDEIVKKIIREANTTTNQMHLLKNRSS